MRLEMKIKTIKTVPGMTTTLFVVVDYEVGQILRAAKCATGISQRRLIEDAVRAKYGAFKSCANLKVTQ